MTATQLTAGLLTFRAEGSTAFLEGAGIQTGQRGRFWRLSVQHGTDRDCPIHSEAQTPRINNSDGTLTLRYDQLRCSHGELLEIRMTVEVGVDADSLTFTARVDSSDEVTIRELTLPVVEIEPTSHSGGEVLYRAEGLGRRIDAPRSTLYRAHTEYMVDDSAGVWEHIAYPGELSMPWQCLETDGHVLYFGRHDPNFSSVLLSAGVPPRGDEGQLWLSATSPIGRSSFQASPVVLSLEPGGWRQAAARYRTWADTWYSGPHPSRPAIHGWQRLIMRHQFGQILMTYDQLVDAYERGRHFGLDGIQLFGWWKAGFDRGYPAYEPDDELGGADELRSAITEIRRRGGFVALYANGNLIDRTSDYPETHTVTKKDYRGLGLVQGYDFARESATTRYFSSPSFYIACHGASEWRETMAGVARIHASLGTDAIFFDQTGFHLAAWPCYDRSHDHGDLVGTEALYRIQTLAGIREAAHATTVGSEGLSDCTIPALSYHHGWGFGFQDEPEAFPAIFRTVFPEPTMSNRLIHDERSDWKDQLNYALTYNLIFDVAIYRCRALIDEFPGYASRIGELTALRRKYADFLANGRFRLVSESAAAVHVQYVTAEGTLDVHWNRSDAEQTIGTEVVPAHDILLAATRVEG